jgi:hypothetical protein
MVRSAESTTHSYPSSLRRKKTGELLTEYRLTGVYDYGIQTPW